MGSFDLQAPATSQGTTAEGLQEKPQKRGQCIVRLQPVTIVKRDQFARRARHPIHAPPVVTRGHRIGQVMARRLTRSTGSMSAPSASRNTLTMAYRPICARLG